VAKGIAKVLQHNTTLHTIFLDQNAFTIQGLVALKLGLLRNKTVKYLPLPLYDMAVLMKDEEIAAKVFPLVKELQKIVYENALNHRGPDDDGGDGQSPSVQGRAQSAQQASQRRKREKRRSVYDESRAALLFGSHLEAPTTADNASEKGSEAGDTTSTDATPEAEAGVHERPKLHKSNSQQVFEKVPAIKTTPATSPQPLTRSLSVTPTGKVGKEALVTSSVSLPPSLPSTAAKAESDKKKKEHRPLVKKATSDRHTRRPSEQGDDAGSGTGAESGGDSEAPSGMTPTAAGEVSALAASTSSAGSGDKHS